MAACIDAKKEIELELKPYDLCKLIANELDLENDCKPKELIALANEKLGREPQGGDASVKEEARAVRQVIRDLPPSFWGEETVGKGNSSPENLVTRLLLKPATAGGFCSGVACRRLPNKAVDTKTVFSQGALSIDGFSVLPSPGQYSKLDFEMENIAQLFGTMRDAVALGHCTFIVQSREQVAPGSSVMTCKANKCSARLIALLTPKFCLVGLYNFSGPEAEAKTLGLFEDLRVEAAVK
jgi:hypothetical protein